MSGRAIPCVLLFVLALSTVSAQPPALTVLRAGPTGELASLDEANEIRIVFSEPMVALGRIPSVVEIPYVRIEPAVAGAFDGPGRRF
jgi:hypothetical protein